eukprot:11486145-Karenia_brevis.AAC.1
MQQSQLAKRAGSCSCSVWRHCSMSVKDVIVSWVQPACEKGWHNGSVWHQAYAEITNRIKQA